MKLARSRSLLDRRVLGAFELYDAATEERITAPMHLVSERLNFVRNRSGLQVIDGLAPEGAEERKLAAHLDSFEKPPTTPGIGSLSFRVAVSDPSGRYVSRTCSVALPLGQQVMQPVRVAMYPAASAPLGQNWAGVRATLLRETADGEAPLAGARLSLLREDDDAVLGSGISDARGEVLAVAVGLPVIDFTTAPPVNGNGIGNGNGNGPGGPAPAPIGTKKVPAKLRIETGPGRPWPADPDAIETNGQEWVPVSGDLPSIELETGSIRTAGLRLLLEPKP